MGMAVSYILERKEILLKLNDMNNSEKAKEIAENSKQYFYNDEYECGLACALRMAQWKDEQLANCIERLEKEYIKNSGKGLFNNEEIAAKLATLRRIEEEMK